MTTLHVTKERYLVLKGGGALSTQGAIRHVEFANLSMAMQFAISNW